MVDNWTGSNGHRQGRRKKRVLAFLLWGYHTERVEGETHRYSPLGLSDDADHL